IAKNVRGVVGEVTLRFRCRLPDSPGPVAGMCTLTVTQAGEDFVLSLPVALQVAGPIEASPRTVLFSAGTPGGLVGKKKQVLVTVAGAEKPAVVEAPPALRHALRKQDDGPRDVQTYLLALEVARPPADAKTRTRVVVQVGADQKKQVVIPVEM